MAYPDYPFRGEHLQISARARMHYLDEGPGDAPAVMMLHGNPSWSFHYRHLIGALCDRYRCIVPDHIGMGLSDTPPDSDYAYTLESRVKDIEHLYQHLGAPAPLDLVVHDWGGMIGCAWAVRHPERIRRLVVLNTAAFPLPETKTMPWQLHLSRLPMLGGLLVRGCNGFCRYANRHCTTTGFSREVAKAYLAPYSSWHERLAVHRFVQDIPLSPTHPTWELVTDTAQQLDKLADKKMLIGWGLQDFVFDEQFLKRWRQRFPSAETAIFDKAGHYVLEDARERLLPRIGAFLDEP
ncbi:MAG: alpha/beta fold hydrolase [Planctomycetota bacterium]